MDLFAGICVRDYEAAKRWYERLLGSEPAFFPHETECVWELGEHRFVYIVEDAERAGNAVHTIFVDDLDNLVGDIAARGIEPAKRETYGNGARKVTYRDSDGNETGFGGAPLEGSAD
jgi:catechol 2,3-dioxygenase-like lactoylglutathione lyase family enzyme